MSSSFIIILVVSLGLFITCQGDFIGDLCSQSINPSLCNQVLRSDPRSNGQNGRALALIALEKGQAAIKVSINVAKSVGNPGNKQQISLCIENFNYGIENLDSGKPLLQRTDRPSIASLQSIGASALTNVGVCSKDFGAGEPSKLKVASDKAYAIAQIFLIIVNTF